MAKSNRMSAWIRQQSRLAVTYLEDGAAHSAARVLRELAETVQERADEDTAALAKIMTPGKEVR